MGTLKQPKNPKTPDKILQAVKTPKPLKHPKKIVGMDVIKPLFKGK